MNKFTVIKNEDIKKYLAPVDANDLIHLIERLRVSKNCNSSINKENRYVVINLDEVYAKEITEIMSKHGQVVEDYITGGKVNMDIKKAKELCAEHDKLSSTVRLIEDAAKENHWVMIKSPNSESYLSNNQIRIVLLDAKDRIYEIEKTLKKS